MFCLNHKLKILLDDIRDVWSVYSYTHDQDYMIPAWTIVRSYQQFCDTISEHYNTYGELPEVISFDHDLADEHYLNLDTYSGNEKTGYDCVKWLVDFVAERGLKLPKWKIHSMNPAGRKNMSCYLENFEKNGGIDA